MDAETKTVFKLFGEALKATNHAIDGVRAHLTQGNPRASDVIQREISAASGLLDQALRLLNESPTAPGSHPIAPGSMDV